MEGYQLPDQEVRVQEVREGCSRAVLVPWVRRVEEEDRTVRSFWRVSGFSLSRN